MDLKKKQLNLIPVVCHVMIIKNGIHPLGQPGASLEIWLENYQQNLRMWTPSCAMLCWCLMSAKYRRDWSDTIKLFSFFQKPK